MVWVFPDPGVFPMQLEEYDIVSRCDGLEKILKWLMEHAVVSMFCI